jgi:hypothetical protein
MLKAIHAQESRDAADRKARAIVDDLRAARMNAAADLVERSVCDARRGVHSISKIAAIPEHSSNNMPKVLGSGIR